MRLSEREFKIPATANHHGLLRHLAEWTTSRLGDHQIPLRFVITRTTSKHYYCEVGVLSHLAEDDVEVPSSVFDFKVRAYENQDDFTAVMLVPTGIDADIGGHAGDACPSARLLGAVCDRLVLHPNVVNAADINEMPVNALYVEGSVLTRFMMGTLGLAQARSNRILVILDDHREPVIWNGGVNAAFAGFASGGIDCTRIETVSPPLPMRPTYANSGRAAGCVENLERLCAVIDRHRDWLDAIAISTVIDVPKDLQDEYFLNGSVVNPYGGVEAMLTHAVSTLYNVPAAHSPMYDDSEIMNEDPGLYEPRKAAEAVSVAFLHSVLKGLSRSPRIIQDQSCFGRAGVISAAEISCLVIPDGSLGLPVLAALQHRIPVISVRENKNLMENDLSTLFHGTDNFYQVENYWEAAGLMAALRAGVPPNAVRRSAAGEMEKIMLGQARHSDDEHHRDPPLRVVG